MSFVVVEVDAMSKTQNTNRCENRVIETNALVGVSFRISRNPQGLNNHMLVLLGARANIVSLDYNVVGHTFVCTHGLHLGPVIIDLSLVEHAFTSRAQLCQCTRFIIFGINAYLCLTSIGGRLRGGWGPNGPEVPQLTALTKS